MRPPTVACRLRLMRNLSADPAVHVSEQCIVRSTGCDTQREEHGKEGYSRIIYVATWAWDSFLFKDKKGARKVPVQNFKTLLGEVFSLLKGYELFEIKFFFNQLMKLDERIIDHAEGLWRTLGKRHDHIHAAWTHYNSILHGAFGVI